MKLKKKYIRWAAWIASLVLVYFLFIQWQRDFGDTRPQDKVMPEQIQLEDDGRSSAPNLIRITTDVLDLEIDLHGGDLVSASLTDYKADLTSTRPVQLLENTLERFYVIRSGLAGKDGPDSGQTRPTYTSEATSYRLSSERDDLSVRLHYLADNGMRITKEFVFHRGDYRIELNYMLENTGSQTLVSRFFGQIVRTDFQADGGFNSFGIRSYVGGALTTPDSAYLKVDFEDMRSEDLNVQVKGGWIAMIQHYFASAWIPSPHQTFNYQTRTTPDNKYILGFVGESFDLAAGDSNHIQASVYLGPKMLSRLKDLAPNIDLTIDYGWLWFIAIPLFYVLEFIHSIVGNWGVAIILLTCLVKLVFYYPSHMSYSSMARMRKLAPQMKSIKDSYASDRQKLQQEMMALYRREKVNPLGGCLPILIQMPVFIALYWMLLESVELRHAPFILWIKDLSTLDPYFIMPLIMGGTMFAQQMLNPTPPDPTQAKIIRLMPVVFTFLFLWFPSGLVLYWITNNSLSILQQWYITKRIAGRIL